MTRDVGKAVYVSNSLRAGTVWVNCYNILGNQAPFGGSVARFSFNYTLPSLRYTEQRTGKEANPDIVTEHRQKETDADKMRQLGVESDRQKEICSI